VQTTVLGIVEPCSAPETESTRPQFGFVAYAPDAWVVAVAGLYARRDMQHLHIGRESESDFVRSLGNLDFARHSFDLSEYFLRALFDFLVRFCFHTEHALKAKTDGFTPIFQKE
jgi:hypothetical protein